MSKERELIKDMKILMECTDMDALQRNADVLIGRAIELLAQPETEQEPVAWIYTERQPGLDWWVSRVSIDKPKEAEYRIDITPLYTSPPKREPLSEDAIINHLDSFDCEISYEYRQGFEYGVGYTEQAHGITGGEE